MDEQAESVTPIEVDRARRLFLYLRDLAELRSRSVRDVADYEKVIWLKDLPAGRHGWSLFHADQPGTDPEIWMEVQRVRLPPVPQHPEELEGWIRLSNLAKADLEEPGLVDPDEDEVERSERIDRTYADYLNRHWKPWQRRYLELKPAFDFYSGLFAMSERRQSLGEVFELVLGIGLLSWTRHGQRIQRHMITAPAELIVDSDTGSIELRPSDAEGRNRFEIDMLQLNDRGPVETLTELTARVEGSDPLALGELAPDILRSWLYKAQAEGSVEKSLEVPRAEGEPTITLAPAIILRRRGQQTLAKLLNSISEEISASAVLPEGVSRLVTTDTNGTRTGSPIGFPDPEVYFPLPSNDEQRVILDRMQQRRGVVVQGPPGTGKSHTIANLVAHLLAQGKRVLVTSHTERALKVLRDKLPEEIQPLCISLLGSDRQSIRELESAVESISARQGDWSQEKTTQKVDQLRATLHEVRAKHAKATNRLRQIREADSHQIELGSYTGTSQQIARQLAEEAPGIGWISDSISEPNPPLTNSEFQELLELRWRLPDEAQEAANAQLPDSVELTLPTELQELFQEEAEYARRRADAASRYGSWVDNLANYADDTLAGAAADLADYANQVTELVGAASWSQEGVADIIAGRDTVWNALREELDGHHVALDEALLELGDAHVEIDLDVSVSSLRGGTRELIAHAEAGKAIRIGWLATGAARQHREILEGTQVEGSAPLSVEQLKVLDANLRAREQLSKIESAWGQRIEPITGPSFIQRRAGYTHHLALLSRVLDLREALAIVKRRFDEVWTLPRPSDWGEADRLEELAKGLNTELANRRSAAVAAAIADALDQVGDDTHPAATALRQAIQHREADAYREGIDQLNKVRSLATDALRLQFLESQLGGAPVLRASIPPERSGTWLQRASNFEQAWRWQYANRSLEELLDPEEAQRLAVELEGLEQRERRILLELTSLLAWSGMFASLTNEQDQALTAWTQAVRRIGRGTGKHADRHRRTARQYMGIARDAIPAWIMPTYRVAESLDASPEPFDVVIVDEASQSGVESLFLFHVGKQVVVVGDDQQIAPDAVGVDLDEVARLQRQYLTGIPFNAEFSPTSSLFDQADIRFGNRVVLREHFRCMPEIIQFSNRISYPDRSLWPLRQYGLDRLDPIKTVYLEHGYREGRTHAINRPEAEEIVARIEKICADPRYDRKTIGVISLQGDAQAKLIDQLLIERLGTQVMAERGLISGDAYAFQGDERDIIFLSMVAAPNARIGALANAQARRRFNVAASRGKDQVWLIHSVRPGELSSTDVRKSLLEYYLDPDVEHWEELANFDESVLNAPFESLFEQDVYLKLRERGFKVTPQVEVGGYRIDLVLHGQGAKLAVECDGDQWHGPDRWEDDSVRQRRLERTGWRFARVRGSAFYRDAESALEKILRQAERLGIAPGTDVGGAITTAEAPITGPDYEPVAGSGEVSPELADEGAAFADEAAAQVRDSSDDNSAAPDSRGRGDIEFAETPGEVAETIELEEAAASAPFPEVTLGSIVHHDRLGTGRVTAVSRSRRTDEPWVRVRFSGGDFDFTPEEFLQAEFRFDDEVSDTRGDALGSRDPRPGPSESQGPATPVDSLSQVSGGDQELTRYETWHGFSPPDPREADRSVVSAHLLSIIEAEGPVTTDRAFKLYIRASGFSRVTRQARRPLNSAIFGLASRLTREEFQSPETNWPQWVVRTPDQPSVVVRELGDRELYEVPLNEIAELMLRAKQERPGINDEDLMRHVLDVYGLIRLTSRAQHYLEAAIEIMGGKD